MSLSGGTADNGGAGGTAKTTGSVLVSAGGSGLSQNPLTGQSAAKNKNNPPDRATEINRFAKFTKFPLVLIITSSAGGKRDRASPGLGEGSLFLLIQRIGAREELKEASHFRCNRNIIHIVLHVHTTTTVLFPRLEQIRTRRRL